MQLYIHDLFRRPVEKHVASWLKDIDSRDECHFWLPTEVGTELLALEDWDANFDPLLVTNDAIVRSIICPRSARNQALQKPRGCVALVRYKGVLHDEERRRVIYIYYYKTKI